VSHGDHSAKPNGGWPPSPRLAFAECLALPRARHSAKGGFAECYPLASAWHSAKKDMPSVWLCRVRHSAKSIFAECPTFGTRQSRKHSAKPLFPVVNAFQIHLGYSCKTTHNNVESNSKLAQNSLAKKNPKLTIFHVNNTISAKYLHTPSKYKWNPGIK